MKDTIIIGAGIIGMLTAIRLQQSGHKVTLIDKNDTGKESSWAGGGIISPLYPWRYHESISVLARFGQQNYAALAEELTDATGISPEYKEDGLLILGNAEIEQAQQWSQTFYQSLEVVSPEQIAEIEPAMRATQDKAVWMPGIAQVRNPRIAKSLRAYVDQLDIDLKTHCQVSTLNSSDYRIDSIQTDAGLLTADNYVICSGAWSGMLLEQIDINLPIHPVKGQMILYQANPGDISRITLEEDRYIIPRLDGRVLFGSTVEHSGFEKNISRQAKNELHRIAVERFPVLADKPIETHWAGLRPGTPEGIPVIGHHPILTNLYVNAGHFRNGVVLAPGSCELLTRIINGEPSELNHPALSPAQYC